VNAKSDFKFIDLFVGIGGIRLALEAVGGKCVFTSEWESYAHSAPTWLTLAVRNPTMAAKFADFKNSGASDGE
jgi:DNA (cytosine-5)-methyltransferase 1